MVAGQKIRNQQRSKFVFVSSFQKNGVRNENNLPVSVRWCPFLVTCAAEQTTLALDRVQTNERIIYKSKLSAFCKDYREPCAIILASFWYKLSVSSVGCSIFFKRCLLQNLLCHSRSVGVDRPGYNWCKPRKLEGQIIYTREEY